MVGHPCIAIPHHITGIFGQGWEREKTRGLGAMAGRMTVQQTYSTKTPVCGRQVSPNPQAVSACRLGSPANGNTRACCRRRRRRFHCSSFGRRALRSPQRSRPRPLCRVDPCSTFQGALAAVSLPAATDNSTTPRLNTKGCMNSAKNFFLPSVKKTFVSAPWCRSSPC